MNTRFYISKLMRVTDKHFNWLLGLLFLIIQQRNFLTVQYLRLYFTKFTFLWTCESLEIFLPKGRRKAGFGKCSGFGTDGVQLCRSVLSVVERAHLIILLLGGFLINSLDSCSSSRFLPCLRSLFSCSSNSTSGKWDMLDSGIIFGWVASFCNTPAILKFLLTSYTWLIKISQF